MAKATSKNTQVGYVAEVTPGVTPATPAFKLLRVTGEGAEVMRKLAFSKELDGKRGVKTYAVASKGGSHPVDVELHNATLDDLLEGLMRSTWTANVLTDGVTRKTFTFETKFETGTTDIYKRTTGAEVDTLSLSMKAQEVITAKLNVPGLDGDYANAAIAGSSYVAANTNPVLVGADFGALTMAGLTVGCVPALDLTFKNNLDPNYCLGSLAATDMTAGSFEVEGNITLQLADDEYEVMRAGADATSTSLSFEIGRTALNKYRIELPVIVLSDMQVKAENADAGTVLITAKITAMQAASLSGSVARITRLV